MSKLVERGKLGAWLLAEVAGVVALHRLGAVPWLQVPWGTLRGWVQTAPPEEVVGAGLRLVGLTVGYWLLASTALYVLARASRIPGAIRTVEWMTLPAVRRVVDRAVALGLATSIAAGATTTAAMAAPLAESRPAAVVLQVSPPSTVSPPARPQPPQARPSVTSSTAPTSTTRPAGPEVSTPDLDGGASAPSTSQPSSPRPPGPRADATPQPAAPPTYTVVRGDNLWVIAADQVAAAGGRQPEDLSPAEIVGYWRQLIDANRDRLRSGDPDLIYPGEELVLPPVPPESQRGAREEGHGR